MRWVRLMVAAAVFQHDSIGPHLGRSIVEERMEYERMMNDIPRYDGGGAAAGVPTFRSGEDHIDFEGRIVGTSRRGTR